MDQPLVSIITPSFNSMPYIRDNIESVLMQGYSNLEHIIIDGGSTDGTLEVLKSYSHLKWISERDRGQSDALNKGFRMAKGAIIGWLNSDDSYNKDAIKTAVKILKNTDRTDIIFSDVNVIDTWGNLIGISKGKHFEISTFLIDNMIKQPSVFMRRKVIDMLGGVDENLHYIMDRELWLRAAMKDIVFQYIEGVKFANFRLSPGTKSYENRSKFSEEWLKVLELAIFDAKFQRKLPFRYRKLLNNARGNNYLSKMVGESKTHGKSHILMNFAKALMANMKLVFKPSVWYFFMLCLVGKTPHSLRKY